MTVLKILAALLLALLPVQALAQSSSLGAIEYELDRLVLDASEVIEDDQVVVVYGRSVSADGDDPTVARKLEAMFESALSTQKSIQILQRQNTELIWSELIEFNQRDFEDIQQSSSADRLALLEYEANCRGLSVIVTIYDLSMEANGKVLYSSGLREISTATSTLEVLGITCAAATSTQADTLTVFLSPPMVSPGDELSLVVETSRDCNLVVVDLTPSSQVTPIPTDYFDLSIEGGKLRYEMSSSTQYGLVVEPTEEIGKHRMLGFCQPGTTALSTREIIKRIFDELQSKPVSKAILQIGQGVEVPYAISPWDVLSN